MYNPVTEQLIRAIPLFDGVDADRLPQRLSEIYAIIIGTRTYIESGKLQFEEKEIEDVRFFLNKIHNGLDSLLIQGCYKKQQKEIAYVAATTYSMRCMLDNKYPIGYVGLDSLSPGINATLLYIIADSMADAAEFVTQIQKCDGIEGDLLEAIIYLVKGKVTSIPRKKYNIPNIEDNDIENCTRNLLLYQLLLGIQDIAFLLLGDKVRQKEDPFQLILELSREKIYLPDEHFNNTQEDIFYGIWRLAKYLIIARERILTHAVINIDTPENINVDTWKALLRIRAKKNKPYLWDNHLNAINQGALNCGTSFVCTFPTGAGKSTLAELKIAATVANDKEVLYLVPTHALESQVKRNLNRLGIPTSSINLNIGGEITDFTIEERTKVHVITPERCMTLLNDDFFLHESIGLIVFDEFHLISSYGTSENMRSITAMMCLLNLMEKFNYADFFLLSAMVKNGDEIAEWIEGCLGRKCFLFDEEWKPTRQLEGCLIYNLSEINDLEQNIKRKKVKKKEQQVTPYCLFCLKNVWNTQNINDYKRIQLLNHKVLLGINKSSSLTGNTNEVSAEIAKGFLTAGYKVLVFTNNIQYTTSIKKKIESTFAKKFDINSFLEKNHLIIEQIVEEIGEKSGTYIPFENTSCVVHHGLLLPEERNLMEELYTMRDGVNMIVATPTLAQGINLPADVVLISGDLRFNQEANVMETLQAHEILNAAGRAGRAGYKSYGVSILIPSKPISMDFEENRIDERWMDIKDNIFANGDHCLEIKDPIDNLMSSIVEKGKAISIEELVFINRINLDNELSKKLIGKTFAAYKASKYNNYESFTDKVNKLILIKNQQSEENDSIYNELSTSIGIRVEILQRIGEWIDSDFSAILGGDTIYIIDKFFDYLDKNPDIIITLLSNSSAYKILEESLSYTNQPELTISGFSKMLIIRYLLGDNFIEIDSLMPNQRRKSDTLDKVRRLIIQVIPSISYMFGIVYRIIKMKADSNDIDIPKNISRIATLIKEGVISSDMLDFKIKNRYMRVTCHKEYNKIY